jgi:hypothetical protein
LTIPVLFYGDDHGIVIGTHRHGWLGDASVRIRSASSATRVPATESASTGGNASPAAPGSFGDDDYSPLVRIGTSGPVDNAPIVASGDAPHDVAGLEHHVLKAAW